MKRFFSHFPVLVAVCLLPSCDLAKLSADGETAKLKEKVAQLEKEREEAALEAELEEARRQLAIALSALDEEASVEAGEPGEGGELDDDPNDLEEFVDIPRAIVVEEAPQDDTLLPSVEASVALEATVPAALLETGDHQIFFAELSRFGEWFETQDYGFVWQPMALGTNPAWRPYTRGRWVNSDQGWTWLSDEPFGWAVYHYGRWVLLAEHGWVWVPGDDWAPAWVSWRQNDDYLGWAPLPPETLYDEVYDYDPGIDLAYDVSPEYYNFVPVDHFYEPVHSHCVPRTTVVTIIISTRNVTRFSMRENHVHCGGPDFAWVNRHARRPARRCQIDMGMGHDHFTRRHHHRLHEDRLHVFAPRVDAPWNAAVCPGRVARNLGRVEIVRAGNREIKRDLRHRYHEAAVRRQESAREALERPECQVALRNNQERRRNVAGSPKGSEDLVQDRKRRRARAEEGLRAATEAVAVAERRVEERKLQPEARVQAGRKIEQAKKELAVARESLDTRGAGRESRSGARGNPENLSDEARRTEMSRHRVMEAKQRALAEEKTADEKRRVLAEQKAAEAKRQEMARQQAVEAKQRALAEEKAMEARRVEIARKQAVEAKQRALAEQKAAEAKRQEMARQQAVEAKQRALAEQKAMEARRVEIARKQAVEAKQRALAKDQAEQKAAEARRVEIARQQALDARRKVVARQRAEESERRAVAQRKVEEARRRAEIEARRKAQIEAQRRTQQEAQRRSEALLAKRRVEEQRAAKERALALGRAQAKAKAQASAQAAALRQKAEIARREVSKSRRQKER
ncbi:MAG: hypothetical protein DBX00_07150 [Verrucomicrobia bacterium]|nr:MAG: hypothetical protein DBX00_07150 [Verrucomicrobiota bacterium]